MLLSHIITKCASRCFQVSIASSIWILLYTIVHTSAKSFVDYYFREEEKHMMKTLPEESSIPATIENVTVTAINSEDRNITHQFSVKAVGNDKLLPVTSVGLSEPVGNEKESLLSRETRPNLVSKQKSIDCVNRKSENNNSFRSALYVDNFFRNEPTVTHHTR